MNSKYSHLKVRKSAGPIQRPDSSIKNFIFTPSSDENLFLTFGYYGPINDYMNIFSQTVFYFNAFFIAHALVTPNICLILGFLARDQAKALNMLFLYTLLQIFYFFHIFQIFNLFYQSTCPL